MRLLCLILSAFLVSACGRADASTTSLPTLTVEYVQADSARVIARWARPCDAKGCADSYRVQWTAGAISRLRSTPALADTIFVTRPAIGDSLVATVAVTAIRRGLTGATRTATAAVRNPDAPPPAVDSLRTDTLRTWSADDYLVDTFPVWVVRDTLGQMLPSTWVMTAPSLRRTCVLGRSRYTGEVRTFVPAEATDAEIEAIDAQCTTARASYAAERDG